MDEHAVLIVDDDAAVRNAFGRVLASTGFKIELAEDGNAALDACGARKYGVVFLDLRMPKMDGLEVLRRLVVDHPEMPVVVISGLGTLDDAVSALRAGAWDFVVKPVENDVLVRAARRAIERSQLLKQNREYSESLQLMNQRLSAALEELQRDERAARQLQFQLLPEDGLRLGDLVCSRRLFPSQTLSGDFVDYFPLGQGFVGLYLADVAGHGAASAFVTAMLKTLVSKYRESLRTHGDDSMLAPTRFLACLDADLSSLSLQKHITLFYAVIELASGKISYANAGAFPFPWLVNGEHVSELECHGRPLNLPGRASFGHGEAELRAGGRLLLSSDGLLELSPRGSQRERRAQMADLLREARGLDDICAPLGLRDTTSALDDDVAFLLVEREQS